VGKSGAFAHLLTSHFSQISGLTNPHKFPSGTHIGVNQLTHMARFKGQAEYSVDAKGRTAIPAKMRAALSPDAQGTFTLTKGFERCIYAYPMDQWKLKEDEYSSLNTNDREARHLVRMILMWAEEVSLDGQGRISLPKSLSEYAGIGDKALIIGNMDRIELWNPEAFSTYLQENSEDQESLVQKVMGS